MFYNTNTHELLTYCPADGYLTINEQQPDGNTITRQVLVQGLEYSDFETRKACGVLPVKSDSPTQPENSYEDVSQRNIVIEDDGVIVTRVYLPNPIVIPETISARQVRLWLLNNNIPLSQVDVAINTISDELLREKTRVEWEYAPYIERHHPLIGGLAQYLGLSSEQIDQGFIDASQL